MILDQPDHQALEVIKENKANLGMKGHTDPKVVMGHEDFLDQEAKKAKLENLELLVSTSNM